ncbi:carbohydrate ABC transporter permease [Paenibacillus filicis]|uniref:Carbohydrate ABC transporter permease n=1 Tax=Paenibacillus gyeongsangnamensis TaxID=3388067 RepID=A0ABT4QF05_9BACL|nr:carbohydrate ABC transporter permease [Paenibacillus filicis]MCZ8515456.1 carbohydrate ABC transporter permease [Paenibacillus filicis]
MYTSALRLVRHGILIGFGGFWFIPFIWIVVSALKSTTELLTSSKWLPSQPTFLNFNEVWQSERFPMLFGNSLWIVSVVLVAQYSTVILAAFVFARRQIPGKNLLFILCMVQLFLPGGIFIFPNYQTIHDLGLMNSKWAIVLPSFASSFGIFYIRQAFKAIPKELEESAVMDGANTWELLGHVFIPLSRSALAAFGIISVIGHWNEFVWPLIVTNTPQNRPVTVGLALFAQTAESGAHWPELTAATLLVVLPLIVIFILFQRKIVESFMFTGIK